LKPLYILINRPIKRQEPLDCFVIHSELISIIYAYIQNPLSNFVSRWHHIIIPIQSDFKLAEKKQFKQKITDRQTDRQTDRRSQSVSSLVRAKLRM